jgi:hypothetical protein
VTRANAGLLVVLLLAPGPVLAQSLGDAAAREKQKRAAAGARQPPRVLSNDDLQKNAGTSGKTSADGTTAPAPEPSARVDPDERRHGGQDEGASRKAQLEQAQAAVDAARGGVVEAEARVKALGDKLNPMSPSFIYGAARSGDAVGEEMRTREALKLAETQLATAREALVNANRAYENARSARPSESPDR